MRQLPRLPPRLGALAFLLVGLALPLSATVQAWVAGPQLHGAVVGLAGPTVVTQEAARRADAVAGRPVEARALATGDDPDRAAPEARRLVARGELDAAVVVDLRRTTDLLLVPAWTGDDVADEIAGVAGAVSASYGRTLRREEVAPAAGTSPLLPFRLTAALVLAGVAVAAAISAWRGPVAATTVRGIARLAGTAAGGAAIGLGVAAAIPGASWPSALAAGLTFTAVAWLVLAAEAVMGLAGLGLATGLLLGPVMPLLGGADPAYLPSPSWAVNALSPQQASLRLLQHDLLGLSVAEARSWLLLGGWALIGLLTLAAARSARPTPAADTSLADGEPALDDEGSRGA